MTESDWLASPDAMAMLYFVGQRASARKLRLFACACSYRFLPQLTDLRLRNAIGVAEQHADSRASDDDLTRAHGTALAALEMLPPSWQREHGGTWVAAEVAARTAEWVAFEAALGAMLSAVVPPGPVLPGQEPAVRYRTGRMLGVTRQQLGQTLWKIGHPDGLAAMANLVREIFPNPFRPPTFDPGWLTWNGGTVRQLAEAMYDDRSFDRMPILGDALEEAGCANSDVLEHCRHGGAHVRGCWVIDLATGKA